jgi:hypothetical protein
VDESEHLICRAALAEPAIAQAAWREWRSANDPAQASDLLTWAGGYIHRNLTRVGVDDPYLAGIARHNWLTNTIKLAHATPLLTQIAARWPIVPLKSFGLGEDTESRRLRPLADIDFYAERADSQKIIAELVTRGFRPLLGADAEELNDRILTQRGSWNFVSENADIDVHWKIMDHLDLAANRELVARWSHRAPTAYGQVRLLQPEATLSLLATHHVLQESGRLSGIFDVFETAKRVDPLRAREFAESADTVEILQSVLAEAVALGATENAAVSKLRETLHTRSGESAFPTPASAARITSRSEATLSVEELQLARVARPWLYRWWLSRRANLALERRLLRLFGPFGNRRIALESAGSGGSGGFCHVLPATERNLGPGWQHLFPGDTWRWAGSPDARVTVVGVGGGRIRLTVTLKADDWRVHTPGNLGVFVNGVLVGQATRHESVIEADVTEARIRDFLEISLRLISGNLEPNTGIASPRNKLLAPVLSLALSIDAKKGENPHHA